jgi:hypothetical protein
MLQYSAWWAAEDKNILRCSFRIQDISYSMMTEWDKGHFFPPTFSKPLNQQVRFMWGMKEILRFDSESLKQRKIKAFLLFNSNL